MYFVLVLKFWVLYVHIVMKRYVIFLFDDINGNPNISRKTQKRTGNNTAVPENILFFVITSNQP